MNKYLSKDQRMRLVDDFIDHRAETESIAELKGFTDFELSTLMNDECLGCSHMKSNFGNCYGKIGGNPCLVFKKTNVVHIK